MNQCNFIGRLGKDPEETERGARFSLAIRNWNSRTREAETMWLSCYAFGKTAERVTSFRKGQLVRVTGQLRISNKGGALIWVDQIDNLTPAERPREESRRPASPTAEEGGLWLDEDRASSDDDLPF